MAARARRTTDGGSDSILAFVDPLLWELGWLAYPLFAIALRRVGVTAV